MNLHTRDIEMLGRTMRVRGVVRVLSRALQTSAVASVINPPTLAVRAPLVAASRCVTR